MAKWYGVIGYVETVEEQPGVWTPQITERPYYGDFNRNTRRYQNSGSVNGDINISNEISIVADPYANQNFHKIRYVEYMGTNWTVTNVDVQYPRLILSIGGLYNGEQNSVTE